MEVSLENRGRSDAGAVVLKCYRNSPFLVSPTDPEPTLPECGWGMAVHREREGDRVRLSVRWHGGGVARSFTGQLALVGWRDYRVRDVGFECAKYGGDLYTDDGGGQIRWNVTSRDHPKGLDIAVAPEPYARCSAFVAPMIDGERLTTQVRVAGQEVTQIPFEVPLANYLGELEAGVHELAGLSAGETRQATVVCTSDVACLVVDSGVGPHIVAQLPGV